VLQKGSEKCTGSIEFEGNRTKGALNNILIHSPFPSTYPLAVVLEVKNNTNPATNIARYVVYCQNLFSCVRRCVKKRKQLRTSIYNNDFKKLCIGGSYVTLRGSCFRKPRTCS
jgi:hypothetical protein